MLVETGKYSPWSRLYIPEALPPHVDTVFICTQAEELVSTHASTRRVT